MIMSAFSGTFQKIFLRRRSQSLLNAGLDRHFDPSVTDSYPGSGTTIYCINQSGRTMTALNGTVWTGVGFNSFDRFTNASANNIDNARSIVLNPDNLGSLVYLNNTGGRYGQGLGLVIWFKARPVLSRTLTILTRRNSTMDIDVYTDNSTEFSVTVKITVRDFVSLYSKPQAVYPVMSVSGGISADPTSWHTIMVSYDTTARILNLYLDGQLAGSTFRPGNMNPNVSGLAKFAKWDGGAAFLTANSQLLNRRYQGSVGVVRSYTNAISSASARAIYESDKSIYT